MLPMVELPNDRILFTVDGFHYPDVAAASVGTYFDRMRRAFMAQARARGYGVIDLDPLFFADFKARSQRFEVPGDGHWNAIGHEVVARAVLGSGLLERAQAGL